LFITSPIVILYLKDHETDLFYEVGRTNIVFDNSYPEFWKPINFNVEKFLTFNKKHHQKEDKHDVFNKKTHSHKSFRFVVFDYKENSSELTNDEIIGSFILFNNSF
jgi:hypothetical protein